MLSGGGAAMVVVITLICLFFGPIGYFRWGVDYLQPEISWQKATCQLHASHLSVMYGYEHHWTMDVLSAGALPFFVDRYEEVMISYDVDVIPQDANSASFRVHTACHEYDVETGTCKNRDSEGSVRSCMDGECSSSAVASSFVGMVAGSKYRNSSINCDCEVCATDAKYCATSIPRLGFMNEDGIGNTEHTPSCCAAGRDDGTTLKCDTYDVSKCSFPFVYEGKKHSSCSIADTGNRIAGNKHIFCGVADASESSGFDYEDCDMGSCNGPVNVSGKLKTADARTGSADPIVPCWYDTLFRARVPQDDRNGVPDNGGGGFPFYTYTAFGLEEFSFHPVSILEPDLAGRNKDDYLFMFVLTLSMIGIGVVGCCLACLSDCYGSHQSPVRTNENLRENEREPLPQPRHKADAENLTEMESHMQMWHP